jgi:hypothetical protein
VGHLGSIPSKEGGLTALARQVCRAEGRERRRWHAHGEQGLASRHAAARSVDKTGPGSKGGPLPKNGR